MAGCEVGACESAALEALPLGADIGSAFSGCCESDTLEQLPLGAETASSFGPSAKDLVGRLMTRTRGRLAWRGAPETEATLTWNEVLPGTAREGLHAGKDCEEYQSITMSVTLRIATEDGELDGELVADIYVFSAAVGEVSDKAPLKLYWDGWTNTEDLGGACEKCLSVKAEDDVRVVSLSSRLQYDPEVENEHWEVLIFAGTPDSLEFVGTLALQPETPQAQPDLGET